MEGAIPSEALPEHFTSHRRTGKATMYLQQLIEQSQSAIANWEAQIAELQAKILEMQQQIQIYGSVQETMKSADLQLINALRMLNQVCPEEISSFRDLVVSRFDNGEVEAIAPGNDDPAPTEPAPQSEDPSPSSTSDGVETEASDQTIDVPAVEVESASKNGKVKAVSLEELSKLDWDAVRKLAKICGINTKGMKRYDVELLLIGKKVTRSQLESI